MEQDVMCCCTDTESHSQKKTRFKVFYFLRQANLVINDVTYISLSVQLSEVARKTFLTGNLCQNPCWVSQSDQFLFLSTLQTRWDHKSEKVGTKWKKET